MSKTQAEVTSGEKDFTCPIPATHDKYNEAHYFIERMMGEYHEPQPFRWNLNAFLQALRAVTFMVQSELRRRDGFESWYTDQQRLMREDSLLRRFVEGRNLVVKQGMLNRRSRIEAGLFRGSRLKLAYQYDLDVDVPSRVLLQRTVETLTGFLIDEEHSAIGEQLGVKRTWVADRLGDEETVTLCDKAWSRVGTVVASAHGFAGARFEPPPEHGHDVNQVNLLLESDVDPSLLEKWGW